MHMQKAVKPYHTQANHNKGGDMRHSTGGKRWRKALGSGIGAACLSFAALAGGLAASSAQAADAHFVLISHAPDSDSWWNTIKNAIKQADEDFNVETDYRNPPNGDLADMSRLIEQAAAHNYDGVIVTIADFDVLKSSIGKVTAKHIPLVTINSGTEEQSAQLGAVMHVGQPEYAAGKAAGMKAKAAGVTQIQLETQPEQNISSVNV